MRRPHSRSRAAVSAALAAILAAGAVTAAGPAASTGHSAPYSTDVDVVNVTTEDLRLHDSDEGYCGLPGWYLCPYYQYGRDSVARVVEDRTEPQRHDGSLRLATPREGDTVDLAHTYPVGYTRPRFDTLSAASIDIRVISGAAPSFGVFVSCPADDVNPETVVLISYSGPYPQAGDGWQTVDLVQGGDALWLRSGEQEPHALRDFQTLCPGGEISGMSLRLAAAGADVLVDGIAFEDQVTNFWIPPLSRESGYYPRRKMPSLAIAERMLAEAVGKRQYVDGWGPDAFDSDDRAYPARRRLPRARAVVIAPQGGPATVMVAAALANAVRGPLLLNPSDELRDSPRWAGAQKVFLVGDREQLSPRVARQLREEDLDVVRIAGRSQEATAVKVAGLVDRRRPPGTRHTVVLADGRRLDDSLAAPAAAGATGGAVLLTRGSSLPNATRKYLADHPRARVYAVGKRAAAARPALPRARKLFGPNPHTTAVKVARRLFPNPTSAVFAPARRHLYALAAASYSGHTGHPLLLLRPDAVPGSVATYLRDHHGELEGSLLVGDARGVDETGFLRTFRMLNYS